MNAQGKILSPRIGVLQFGTGAVGGALLQQLGAAKHAGIALIGIANTRRQCVVPRESNVAVTRAHLDAKGQPRDDSAMLVTLDGSDCERRAIIDATASPQVAAKHAVWLREG
ncbi:MAG TPA: homoserine dehydrogenase, partial [Rhodanobacteraceae bacterium]|nr:homoserine dehydrogenase [Rhodanobacteraceae bacterium]